MTSMETPKHQALKSFSPVLVMDTRSERVLGLTIGQAHGHTREQAKRL